MITEESVKEVLETARIEDVVGDFVNLRRRGQNMIGLCPFHSEKTPSFNVNPARNIYKCFGCGEGGDPVKFLMEHEQLSFVESIRWLANKYGLKLREKEVSEEYREEQQAKESLYLTNQFAHDHWQQQLFESDRGRSVALKYLRDRGYSEATIRKFGLGYAQPEWDHFTKVALQAGYPAEQLEKLGLSRDGRDFFRDRVMFTIHNLSGKPMAFAGRILQKNARAPKYINSPETEIYHKSDVLYGIYQARQAIRKQDECYLVEGYTDVISLHQGGVENVVASSGTSLTSGQVRLLKRYTDRATLLYDGDKAGIKAALRGLDVLLEQDLNVRVVMLPEGEDPDSYMNAVGSDDFKSYLQEQARDFIMFQAELMLEEAAGDPMRKAGLIKDITRSISLIPDPLKRSLYIKECARLFGVDEQLLVAEVNRLVAGSMQKQQQKQQQQAPARPRSAPSAPPAAPDDVPWPGEIPPFGAEEDDEDGEGPGIATPAGTPKATGHEYQERDLARILITSGMQVYDKDSGISVAQYILDNIEDVISDFDHPLYRQIAEMALQHIDEHGRPAPPEFFLHHSEEKIQQLAIDFHATPYLFSENWEKRWDVVLHQKDPKENYNLDSDQALKRFRLLKIARMCQRNIDKIRELATGGSDEELLLHLQLQQRLQQLRDDLAAELGTVIL